MLLGPVFGVGAGIVNEIIWADTYQLRFEGGGGAVDELLVCLVAAIEDLTRDRVGAQSVTGAVSQTITQINAASSGIGGDGAAESMQAR